MFAPNNKENHASPSTPPCVCSLLHLFCALSVVLDGSPQIFKLVHLNYFCYLKTCHLSHSHTYSVLLLLSFLFFPVCTSTFQSSKGLKDNPWCNPTLTSNPSVPHNSPPVALSYYMCCTTLTYFSATPGFLMQYHSSLPDSLSHASFRSTKTQLKSFWHSHTSPINTFKAKFPSVVLFCGMKLLTDHYLTL